MHRRPDGGLLMLWSGFGAGGYTVGAARSESGRLSGPWRQDARPLFAEDGGHCMTFRDFKGKARLALHRPNRYPDERAQLMSFDEKKLV
jgi:arabinan endo-1,5-alpha-L-arabinosidase